jgi:multicomponent Na+:H+ antiporter subunit G
MSELIKAVLIIVGAAFLLVASVGVLRMPDLFTRMSASAKAGTLGIGCMLAAVAIHFDETAVTTRAILIIAYFFLTAPVAAHMVARAAYLCGVPLWKHTIRDELHGRYNPRTRTIESPPDMDGPADGE